MNRRPEYASFVIDEINAADQLVKFKNGAEIGVGQTQGADRQQDLDVRNSELFLN